MIAKLGWLIFVAGFILAAIGSVSKPNERLKMRGDITFTAQDIKNVAPIIKRLGNTDYLAVKERLPFAYRWLLFGGDEQIGGGVLSSAQLKLDETKARQVLALAFNEMIQAKNFYQKPVFDKLHIRYSPDTQRFIDRILELGKSEPKIAQAKKAATQAQKIVDKTLLGINRVKAMDNEQKQSVAAALTALNNAVAVMELANKKNQERKTLFVEISPILNRLLLEDIFGGNLTAVRTLPAWYLIALGTTMGIFGLAFIYKGKSLQLAAQAKAKEAKDGSGFNAKQRISDIVAMLKKINAKKDDGEKVQKELEIIQLHYIFPFVEHRGILSHQMGLAGFASMFSDFSTAERYVNRAWSAIVDAQPDECVASIETAIDNFNSAIDNF